jgi:hypothetical protein
VMGVSCFTHRVTGHQYPKDLNYPTINRNTMSLRNLGHGYQTTCKQ